MKALLEKAQVPAALVEDIHWGCVKQEKEQGYDIARMAALIAGFPIEVGGATVNRNCGSSLQAIHQAAQSIAAGCEDVQIAGGVEHMHHIPMEAGFDPSPRYLYRHSAATLNMGLTAENLAQRYHIERPEQDAFALRSHRLAAASTDGGAFAREIIPTWGRDAQGRKQIMRQDECIRRDTSAASLAALKPVFMPRGGSVTAGNASPLNVGAAALLIMSEERAKELGLKPLVAVRAMAVAGVDPSVMGIGPVPATHKALERAGLKLGDIDLIEINEAFAVQTLAVIKLLAADPEKVNVRGGASRWAIRSAPVAHASPRPSFTPWWIVRRSLAWRPCALAAGKVLPPFLKRSDRSRLARCNPRQRAAKIFAINFLRRWQCPLTIPVHS